MNIAREVKKAVDDGRKLNLTDEEIAFYDLLSSKEKLFENYDQIRIVVKEIVKEMGYFTKVADWNRKEYLKARIKTVVKNVLMRAIDGRASYSESREDIGSRDESR